MPPTAGSSIVVTDTTQDIGLGVAGVSRTYFNLSSDGVTQGMYLGDRGIVPLAASGGSSTGSTTLTLPAYLIGTYYIIGCANGANQVPESNTSNNCMATSSFNLLGADLVISNVGVPSHASGTIAVANTTTNQPGGSLAGSSATYIYFSTDGVTLGKLLGGHNVAALAPGASSSATTTVTLPSGLSSGSYFVIVCADATNTVPESNEANNCTASSAFSVP